MSAAGGAGHGASGGVVQVVSKIFSSHIHEPNTSLGHSANSVIYQSEGAGDGSFHFNDDGTARRDDSRLDIPSWGTDQIGIPVDSIKDATNNVEGRDEIGAGVTKEEASNVRVLHFQGAISSKCPVLSIENHIGRMLSRLCEWQSEINSLGRQC